MGLVFLLGGLIPFDTVRSRLDLSAGDGSADRYTPVLHLRLQWAALGIGAATLALGTALPWMGRRINATELGGRFRCDLKRLMREVSGAVRSAWLPLLVLSLSSLAVRVSYLHLPIRYDEAHSWLEYSSMPWFVTVSKYDDPNNHIFHNLLVNLVGRVLGHEPWQLRLLALLAGVLIAPLTFLVARQWLSVPAAWVAGLICVGSSPLIEYSVNARGYTLVMVWTLLAYAAAEHFTRTRNLASGLGLILAGALGLWTVPTMILSLVSVWVWMVLLMPTRQRTCETFAVAALTLGTAAVLYSPVLLVATVRENAERQESVAAAEAQSHNAAGGAIPDRSGAVRRTMDLLLRDMTQTGFTILFGLSVLGCRPTGGTVRPLPRLVLASLLSPMLVVLLGIEPPARVWLYGIPLLAFAAAAGLDRIARGRDPEHPGVWCLAVLIVGVAVVHPLFLTIRRETIVHSRETGVFPDARQCLLELSQDPTPDDRIVAAAPTSAPLVYEAGRMGLPASLFQMPLPGESVYVVATTTMPQSCESVLGQLNMEPWPDSDTDRSPRPLTPVFSLPSAEVYRVKVVSISR